MGCTTILVGKKASFDGSTLVARNEDSPSGIFMPKKFIVVEPEDQPKVYKSVLSHVEIQLPSNPIRYTCMPNGIADEGIWGAYGVNAKNVSMTATETLTTNERVLAADPLVKYVPSKGEPTSKDFVPEKIGGIGEEDIVTLVLPYINSAREGVLRLGEILSQYGTYEMNGIAFQDVNEIWWLETIGGHHWIARRVPDDSYVIMPNQLGIDNFDLDDAFGAQENHLCSSDLREFIEHYHLDLSFDGQLNPKDAFGSHSDADHVYNTPRSWVLHRFFNPTTYVWDGEYADFTPNADNIPWAQIPERKITVEDIKYVLSHHYQGTPYDCYGKFGDKRGIFRPIGINRNNFLGLVQIRPYAPEEIAAIQWMSLGSNVFNAMIPFYSNVTKTPEYFANSTARVTTDNFYWTNRIIGALSDAHFSICKPHIERYQLSVQSKTMGIINNSDADFVEKFDKLLSQKAQDTMNNKQILDFCEQVNEKIAKITQLETEDVLDKVLYTASNAMKNGFSRSDS